MASTTTRSTTARPVASIGAEAGASRPAGLRHRGRRMRATAGPRLRPVARLAREARGRGSNSRPGGVAAPSVTPQVQPQFPDATATAHVAVVAAPEARRRVARPAQAGVHLTERGMLAVLVVFGGLVAASVAVIATSFFQVSNAPLPAAPASPPAVQAAGVGQLGG